MSPCGHHYGNVDHISTSEITSRSHEVKQWTCVRAWKALICLHICADFKHMSACFSEIFIERYIFVRIQFLSFWLRMLNLRQLTIKYMKQKDALALQRRDDQKQLHLCFTFILCCFISPTLVSGELAVLRVPPPKSASGGSWKCNMPQCVAQNDTRAAKLSAEPMHQVQPDCRFL